MEEFEKGRNKREKNQSNNDINVVIDETGNLGKH